MRNRSHLSADTCLLIVGLVLFNLGCFLKPSAMDRVFRLLDVRLWPCWFCLCLFALTLLAGHMFISHKRKISHCFRLWLFVVITGSVICIFRLGYDVKTWRYGSTITVYATQPGRYDYILHLPRGYHDFGKRPLIIFLHGAGETGKDVCALKKLDLFHYADGKIPPDDFPFIVVSPITPKHGWDSKRLVTLLDELLNDNASRYNIDPNRVYLTGFSMGGFGTFQTACDFPERFAAIVPLAGGGDPERAEKLMTVPAWAFHGNADNVVDYEQTEKMILAMQELRHPEVQLTTLHGAGHGIPDLVYTNPELYRWLLKQRKKQP